jgi:hypothetical protein
LVANPRGTLQISQNPQVAQDHVWPLEEIVFARMMTGDLNYAEESDRSVQGRNRQNAVYPAVCFQGWKKQLYHLLLRPEAPLQVRHLG